MKTREETTRERLQEAGFTITNQGNPKRIRFTVAPGDTIDEVTEAVELPSGFVIRKNGSSFVAVDIRK